MSGVSTTSTTTLKTDDTSKVLPGDKTGLPLEIWQYIFSYLSVKDLCHVARVSKTWYDLSLSIDLLRWKELYLACQEWRHPYWPLNAQLDPPSWKSAYRNQHLSTRFWHRCSRQTHKAGCMTLLKRVKERQTIEVGPGKQHETLKSAFAIANEYDRVLVYPGIYDEQLEMSLKVPYELVGVGELGSVILVGCMEHIALSGRFSNLVIRAPWFTNFILKVRSGYLQMDNCIMEDGMMCVANPATCHIQFCTFRHATVILQHINASIIRNCEFSQSDNANIVIEGYPKEEKSWAYPHLCQQMDLAFSHKQSPDLQHRLKATESTTSTLHSTFTGKSFTTSTIRTFDTLSRGRAGSQDADFDVVKTGAVSQGGISNGVGKKPAMINAGINHHGASVSGTNGRHAFNAGAAEGNIDSHVITSHAHTDSRNKVVVSDCSHGNCADPHRQISSDPHTDDVSRFEHSQSQACGSEQQQTLHVAEKTDNKNSSGEACSAGHSKTQDSKTQDDEWLEINDERKFWQLSGEERGEKVAECAEVAPQEMLKEAAYCTDLSSTGKPCSSGANTVLVSPTCVQQTDTVGDDHHSQDKCTDTNNVWRVDDAEHVVSGSATTDRKDDAHRPGPSHLADRFDDLHHKHSSEQNVESGADVQTTAVMTHATPSSGSHAGGFPESITLHQSFSGEVFPQNLPPLNSGPSRYHYHNPPPLQNQPSAAPHQACSVSQQGREHNPVPHNEQHLPCGLAVVRGEEEERRSRHSFHSSRNGDSSSDEDDLSILDGLESGGSSDGASDHGNNSTSSSDDESEGEIFNANSEYDSSDAEESVIMLPHLRQKHLDASLSANAVNADVGSVCSQTSPLITLSASQDEGVLSHVHKVRGCLVHQCRMMHSKGGVMVSLQGHAIISGCDISNVSYGIRCIQNARVVIVKNRIHHCRTSGIFMRLAASGLIAGNDIHSNNEAGLDIRKNADPIVQHNRIHHGKRSGVVVLGSGRGQIRNNSIYSNTEAGIYILYGGNPSVSENHIYDGKAAGVAVNEGGQGFIFDNSISSNQWGGVDIRRGSCPMVCRNTITNGQGDGIVIGDQGQGTIENNVITDNAGCGLWLMSASRPYIHGNQISNNGDTGVMMVNKTDIQHDGTHLLPAGTEMADHISRSLSLMGALLDDIPSPLPKCCHTTLQHNNIYHNAGRGVAVELGDKVDMMYNTIYANHQDGVWIHQDSLVTLRGNSISNNYGHGVVTALTPSIEISGNGIYDNLDCGIQCSGNITISENDIVGNQRGGVHVDNNSICKIKGNRIHAVFGPAVKLATTAGESVVEGNKVCVSDGKEIQDLSQRAAVHDNKIMQHAAGRDKAAASSRHKTSKESSSAFNKSHFLRDPPPRPAVQPPPPPTTLPAHNISTVTKVMVPSGDTCQQGSKLCRIL